MNIAGLDFFSEPPQINYCKKETNQTFFGGILFFIYIAVMVIISAIYTLDYFINDKYDIQYSLIKNTESNALKLNQDQELNPMINMSIEFFKMSDDNETKLSNRFLLLGNAGIIDRGKFFKTRANETFLELVYLCPDDNCTLDENDTDPLGYYLEMTYKGYKLDHQSETIPLDVNADRTFTEEYPFFFDNTLIRRSQWEVIKYVEERGIAGLFDKIFNRKSEFIGGFISSTESYTLAHSFELDGIETKAKAICLIIIENNHFQYTEYKRARKSFLDVLANIGALFSTFFAVFIFVYKYYSRNYDNYYLVDKILSSKKIKSLEAKNRKTKKKDIELTSNVLNEENNADTNKESPLIGDVPDANSLNINDNDDADNDRQESIVTNFKNLKFMDFVLNNFNCKCCKKRNQAEIIDTCNEILSKYISVDIILYNQIMMENLLKDYKWNDPQFSSLKSNDLILKLDRITLN